MEGTRNTMIDYDNDFEDMDLSCDEVGCSEETTFHGSWQDCIDQAKGAGWKIRKVKDDWTYTCPDDAELNDSDWMPGI